MILKKFHVVESTSFETEAASEADCLWTPDLRSLSGSCSFVCFSERNYHQLSEGALQYAMDAKVPGEGRLPWKHFCYPNSHSYFLHQQNFWDQKHQHFSDALTWKGQGLFLERTSPWTPSWVFRILVETNMRVSSLILSLLSCFHVPCPSSHSVRLSVQLQSPELGPPSKMIMYRFNQRQKEEGREMMAGEKWRKNEKALGRRKEEESCKGRWNNEGLRPSQAHGSSGTSVPPASGQQLHAAQRVGAESRSQNREPPCRSRGGPVLVGICKLFFSFLFH